MENKFRFYKTKKNKFVFTDDKRFRIVYGEPRIQPFDSRKPVRSEKDILYYYYSLEIFLRVTSWRRLTAIQTHDFPSIILFRDILDSITKLDIKKQYFSTEPDGKRIYSKTMQTDDLLFDDYYEIKRTYRQSTDTEWYDIYIGTATDVYTRMTHLTADDVWALRKCVNSFIKFSINQSSDDTETKL